jgi:hypothetical protein
MDCRFFLALQGVPTRAQLADRFPGVARVARELALLPGDRPLGVLSLSVAKLAAKLKVRFDGEPQPGNCDLGATWSRSRSRLVTPCSEASVAHVRSASFAHWQGLWTAERLTARH